MLIKTTKFCTLLLGIGAVSFLQAQTLHHVTMGPLAPNDNIILTALKGPKVTLSNPILNLGDRKDQIRTFSNGLAAGLQMDTGVLFGTGENWNLLSNNNNPSFSSDIGNTDKDEDGEPDPDPDLTAIRGNEDAKFNTVSYEFDVTIPNTATAINVAYQFGSDEYPYYVGSKFNDAFGFFISGPGIDENTENNINGKINIARIEHNGVNVPTSINTINQGIYGEYARDTPGDRKEIDPNVVTDYYINNGHLEGFDIIDGKRYYSATDLDPSQIKVHTQFNGMTKKIDYPLKGLQPGGTYRFKIVIADTADGSVDSGVFIDAISAFADIEARNNDYTIDAGSTSTTSVLANDVYKGDFGIITVDNTQVQKNEESLPREFVTISTPFNIVKVETDGTKTNSSGFTLDNDGKVIVDGSVAPGTYEFNYNICDAANPDFCSTAKVTVVVKAETKKCYKPGNFTGQGEPTKFGISTVGQPNDGWPENVPSGHIVMESRDKGFVITQVTNTSAITNPVEGMLVYDLTDNCVKLYNSSVWKCLEKNCD